jgi:hypothetical protein
VGADGVARGAEGGVGGVEQDGGRMKELGRLTPPLVMLLLATSSAGAQRDIQILAKEDAAKIFVLSKAQWREHLVNVEKARIGTRAGDALILQTPAGTVTTLPIYSDTDARPSRLEVSVVMPRDRIARFDDSMADALMRDVRRQMEPEYVAEGRAERIDEGAMRFFFTVSETRK